MNFDLDRHFNRGFDAAANFQDSLRRTNEVYTAKFNNYRKTLLTEPGLKFNQTFLNACGMLVCFNKIWSTAVQLFISYFKKYFTFL
jgi:hypothetical protein